MEPEKPALWTPPPGVSLFGPHKYRANERIVTLPSGERVRVWNDDSRHVSQIEHDHTLDAVVRPDTIRVSFRREREQGRGA